MMGGSLSGGPPCGVPNCAQDEITITLMIIMIKFLFILISCKNTTVIHNSIFGFIAGVEFHQSIPEEALIQMGVNFCSQNRFMPQHILNSP